MNKFFKDKRVLFAISLIISIGLWLTVSLVLRPSGEIVVSGVGVNINVQSGFLNELGLSAIEGSESTVNVTISGSRAVIGGVSAEDIFISPSLSGVSGAGEYELELKASNNGTKDFDIISVSPATIKVKFDKYVDKIVDLEYNVNGEYNIPDEFIQEEIYTDPSQIVITGPERDLADIDKAVVEIALFGDYSETIAVTGDVMLVDEKGEPINYNKNVIKLSTNTATVYVPVYKTAVLPITFDYTNVPKNFDLSNLKYSLSVSEILAEGEDSIIDKYSDIFVGYIDIRRITIDNTSESLSINLPEGLTMQNGVNKVDINFDLTDYAETVFNATQITIINVPKDYKVSSNTKRVSVTLIGPKEVVNSISPKDIVVEVDLSAREITQTGQYKIQAEVFLPEGVNAWAIGTYSITVTVKEA